MIKTLSFLFICFTLVACGGANTDSTDQTNIPPLVNDPKLPPSDEGSGENTESPTEKPNSSTISDNLNDTSDSSDTPDNSNEIPDSTSAPDNSNEVPDSTTTPDNSTEIPDSTSAPDNSNETPDSTSAPDNSNETPDSTTTPVNSNEVPDSTSAPDNSNETPDSTSTPDNSNETPDSTSAPDNSNETPDSTTTPVNSNETPDSTTTPDNSNETPDSTTTPDNSEAPYNEQAIELPGIIEAEFFNQGNEGIAFHDLDAENTGDAFRESYGVDIEATQDLNGNFNIGWTESGEWLNYSVNVNEAGNYDFNFRIASLDQSGEVYIEDNGENITGNITFTATGGWQTWNTHTQKNILLEKGLHQFSLKIVRGGFNLNYIDITRTSMNTPTDIPEKDGWSLIWNDEFSGNAINPELWEHEVNANGGGNNELQYYTARKENAFIENGELVLKAIKENYTDTQGTRDYTSARLRTLNKGDFLYGRVEVRAKLPAGQGLWPAIWMLPTDYVYGGWAASGEIDIMEAVNLQGSGGNNIHGTLHYGGEWPANDHSGAAYTSPHSVVDTFHTYTVEWEPGEVRWYVDDTHYQTQTQWWSANADYPAPFNQRFHIVLNVAVGGNWPGNPNAETAFPQTMNVDYVRVYQKNPNQESKTNVMSLNIYGHATMPEAAAEYAALIQRENIDVLGIQEGAEDWQISGMPTNYSRAEQLHTALGECWDRQYQVFVNTCRGNTLLAHTRFDLTDGPNAVRTGESAIISSHGTEYSFINIHWDHQNTEARWSNASETADIVNAQQQRPVIVLGDFNAQCDSDEVNYLRENTGLNLITHAGIDCIQTRKASGTGRKIDASPSDHPAAVAELEFSL